MNKLKPKFQVGDLLCPKGASNSAGFLLFVLDAGIDNLNCEKYLVFDFYGTDTYFLPVGLADALYRLMSDI